MNPSVVVFDVNETLSDMSPMGQRFIDVGAPGHLAKLWFATLLRDGFALTAAGDNGSFSGLGAEALRSLFSGMDLNREIEPAVQHVMAGFSSLGLHADVTDGIKDLRAAGYEYAASACETKPEEMLLVAVHPWDIHGASRAGLATAWINRTGGPYPGYFHAPDHTVSALADLVPALARGN